MTKKLRYALIVLASLVLVFFIGLISANLLLKNKIENFVANQLPPNVQVDYKKIDLNLLGGTITCFNVQVALQNKSNKTTHTTVVSDKLIIEDVSYWDYLFHKEIRIEDIKIKSANIVHHKDKLIQRTDSSQNKGPITLYKPVLIEELSIDHATLHFFDGTQDSTTLYVANSTIEIDDIVISRETLSKRLPATFGDYNAKADSIFLKMSPYENLTVGALHLKDKHAVVKDIQLKTKYSKSQHAQLLQKERDHFAVQLDSIDINNIDFGFNNRKFFGSSTYIELHSVQAEIYRNKLVANDTRIKPLYSKMLRDLPIDLTVDSLAITNSNLSYEEKVKAEHPAGEIYFKNMNAYLSNVSNTYSESTRTRIHVTAQFMKTSPIEVDWSFDVNDTSDSFTFKADVGRLAAPQMNSFTKPNLNVALEGEVHKTYFSVYGSSSQSNIDMQIEYEDFKVNLLKDDGKNRKTLLSGIVNIFVSKDSKDDGKKFSKGTATVTPDRTKSFFNYLWLNVQAALKDCLL